MEPPHCFISYAREDLDRVRPIVKLIKNNGWSVFWDRTIPSGLTWRKYIGKALDEAKCVIVVWSKNSIKSEFVQEEADDGRERSILIPILIDDVRPPLGFRAIQHEDLTDWKGESNHRRAKSLIKAIEGIAGKPEERVTRPSEEPKSEVLPSHEQLSSKAEKPTPDSPPHKATDELSYRPTESSPKRRITSFFLKFGPLVVSLSFATIIFAVGIKYWDKAPNQSVPVSTELGESQTGQVIQKAERLPSPIGEKVGMMGKLKKEIPKPESDFLKTFTNKIGMKFLLIPAGTFTMGSDPGSGFDDEHPQHPVEITKPFYLQKTEVTQGQWKEVMGDNPSSFKDCGDGCPVEQVSWDDTQMFIKKLNDLEGTDTYRLPTEAEWEYAARAETTTMFSFGDDAGQLGDFGWYAENSGGKTHPVSNKKPNPWGLYDMHGNVWEWVEDWYDDYNNGSATDPKGPPTGTRRVMRGGSFGNQARYCRSAERYGPKFVYRDDYGFRLARSITLGP